ncbi:GIY-YIG nuclease family protein [Candidatus Falkowbacteria bacterium]|jgi:putative endonuclease|nr:GIY-YIG nuclease family protein [Candidatus Falkowbacteria bacterium]MBT5502760.1 GIY-YIG nuclease family protein [Candidatus Falkowbacteria bacterium]MBT6573457.1 GIY-YIG nuclease family protein [Candidatus Falkowbacteria bacterium]MBT7348286.1 GIY-YIG nuclease family protein [Candidatus Falkowbacteria bacterium]MBT7501158.1 GIY-YIG nuclease family protein [Candidatus Falkowbacteria bacterium]
MQKPYFVYLIESINHGYLYKGFTEISVFDRLKHHNDGRSKYTNKYKPWKLKFYCAFDDKIMALNFETYLKTASGIAFTNKRFIKK